MSNTTDPENKAREKIDDMLKNNGWPKIKESRSGDTGYREEVTTNRGKSADYVLYINGDPIAIIEAKKKSIDPYEKRDQPRTYAKNLNNNDYYNGLYSVPFTYTSNGEKILFEDLRKDARMFREVYTFHKPKDLSDLEEKDYSRIMDKIRKMSSDDIDKGLWDHQKEGFDVGLDNTSKGKNKLLYTMATGSGKTRLAVSISKALLETKYANRILFAVDTDSLRRETIKDYKTYQPVGSSSAFSEKFLVGNLDEYDENNLDVVVTTTQKLSRRLHSNEHDYSVSEFDVVIADEAHRGVFNVDGQAIALDYFDALEIGLTATPHKLTKERYNHNEIFKYDYNDALDDGHVSPFKTYTVDTQIMTRDGIEYDGKIYTPNDIGEDVIVKDSHRKVAKALRENVEIDDELTLFFVQNQKHAQILVDDLREMYRDIFDNPQENIKRVTGDDFQPDVTLAEFRQPYRPPRIIVTVDMVTTGVDIRALNNIVMMRPVKSKILFNQMIGRGTRTHETKDHFKIFDCVAGFEYHDELPPFATGNIEYEITDPSDSEIIEPKKDPEVIGDSDIDKVIDNSQLFPSKDNEWVNRKDFVKEIQMFINKNSKNISESIKNISNIKQADEKIEDILLDEWKYYSKETVLDAFENIDSLYMLCVRTIEGYEMLNKKADIARDRTINRFDLNNNQKEIISEVSHRSVIEKKSISKSDFYTPPLSSNGGISRAENEISNLDEVLKYYNKQFLNIDV